MLMSSPKAYLAKPDTLKIDKIGHTWSHYLKN